MRIRHPARRSARSLLAAAYVGLGGLLVPAFAAVAADDPSVTAPSAARSQPALARDKVVFSALKVDEGTDSALSAIRAGTADELQSTGYRVSQTDKSIDTAEEAQRVAADQQARYVVYGHCKTLGSQSRVSAQVYDAAERRSLGLAKATTDGNKLLDLQDSFTQQVKSLLGGYAPASGGAGGQRPVQPWMETTSHWAGFEPAVQQPIVVAPQAPAAAPQPRYMNGAGYSPYYGGYGYGYGPWDGLNYIGFGGLLGGPTGVTRVERLGSLGVSINPPSSVPTRTPGSVNQLIPAPASPVAIPPYRQPIQKYVNPYAKFASPAGQPQRVNPPSLRPGASSSASN